MTIREAVKAQRESIKNRSPKERFSFFWEYYALKTFVALIALIVLVAFIVTMVTKKDYALTGMFFGAEASASSEDYLADFAENAGIDTSENLLTVQFGPDIRMDQQVSTEIYQSMETFVAMVAAGSMDCFSATPDLFLYYAYMDYAVDLRTVLTAEELTELAPYLYYIDAQLIREQEADNGGYTDAYQKRPDPTQPEKMQDPIPVAISLEAANETFLSTYRFPGTSIIGICASSQHRDNALAFLRYCLAAK